MGSVVEKCVVLCSWWKGETRLMLLHSRRCLGGAEEENLIPFLVGCASLMDLKRI